MRILVQSHDRKRARSTEFHHEATTVPKACRQPAAVGLVAAESYLLLFTQALPPSPPDQPSRYVQPED